MIKLWTLAQIYIGLDWFSIGYGTQPTAPLGGQYRGQQMQKLKCYKRLDVLNEGRTK